MTDALLASPFKLNLEPSTKEVKHSLQYPRTWTPDYCLRPPTAKYETPFPNLPFGRQASKTYLVRVLPEGILGHAALFLGDLVIVDLGDQSLVYALVRT